MAVQKPLVLIGGVLQQLPSGDTIDGAGGGSVLAWEPITVTNPSFETGDATGWTTGIGTPSFKSSAGFPGSTGSWVFDGGSIAENSIYQDFDITSDTGTLFYRSTAILTKDFTDNDVSRLELRLIDSAGKVLGFESFVSTGSTPTYVGATVFIARHPNAVTLRITAANKRNTGTNNNTAVDSVTLHKLTGSAGSGSDNYIELSTSVVDYVVTNTDLLGNKLKRMNDGAALNVTVPPGLTGTEPAQWVQYGVGQITFIPGAGVTINSADGALKTRVRYSAATLVPDGVDTYLLFGDLVVV